MSIDDHNMLIVQATGLTVFVELKLLAAETDLLMTADLSASDDGLDLSDMVPL